MVKKKRERNITNKNFKTKDISNQTVLIVLVLVIISSVLSMGVFLKSLGDINVETMDHKFANGKVSFRVIDPVSGVDLPVTENGKVTLQIIEPSSGK